MTPKLIALDGPRAGEVFSLEPGDLTIGRDPENHLSLNDPLVSRRHCVLHAADGMLTLEDLDSRNGVFVDRRPVRRHHLRHGEQVQIGRSTFAVVSDADAADTYVPRVEIDPAWILSGSTISIEAPAALAPIDVGAALAGASERPARELDALLRVGTALVGVRDTKLAERALLQTLFDAIPAERGAVLLAESEGETSASIFAGGLADDEPMRISRTVVNQVLREGRAILCNDVLEGDAFGGVESLVMSRIQSLLAVPLAVRGRALGVVYLDTSNQATRFDEGHLQLAMAAAGIAGLAVENSRYVEWLEGERQRLRTDIAIEHQMIGESQAMQDVYRAIQKVAGTDSTVLIRGESGTGKELVARAIHENSPRATKPFIAINCATLTETLLESELFGYEKGAFTGAISQRRGKLEVADGGTVFLDEIGEVPPALQAKLLRAIQERQFERVGGTQSVRVDVRWIAATNAQLEQAIERGRFRRDLFYRLNVISLTMPPLRERREDIPLLASYFAAKYGEKCNRRVAGISREARACLVRYSWPGNVRELENAVERAVVLGSTDHILPEDLPDTVLEANPATASGEQPFADAVADYKRLLVLQALERADGDFTKAAKLLGLHPRYIYRLVKSLNIDASDYAPERP